MSEIQTPGSSPKNPQDPDAPQADQSAPEIGLETPGVVVPVAGIGGSAGGLEVFQRLLARLPPDCGLAIVFIQHLDPTHGSMLTEILARSTAMPVTEAADGIRIEANHVYVIPENADLTLADGALKLSARTPAAGLHLPIDRFLQSLAEQLGNRSIGVILSGAGSDGSAGVAAIKAAGGVTFAQDAASAKFPTMPQSAVATGCVDFVLPPEDIAVELAEIGRHPYLAINPGGDEYPKDAAVDEMQLSKIFTLLHGATGIDFSLYRTQTIVRRILRRLALNRIDSIAAYAVKLQGDPGELNALQNDLLICVTSFFRDGAAFESLTTSVFPAILRDRAAQDPIRIWVAGCATGEEAYSIAIALQEYQNARKSSFPVLIFGSDVSQRSIDVARLGRYPENIATQLSPDRLSRYFTKIETGYRVNKELREMCVFTRHNLIGDPPFSKLDLISCRNVLIYLGSIQKSIFRLFHYALKPAGFLFLGTSEGGAPENLFLIVEREHRIFGRKEAPNRTIHLPGSTQRGGMPAEGASLGLREGAGARNEVDRILLSKYSPSGVVVDQDLDVVEIRGQASPYLSLPAGKATFQLAKLIPDAELFLEVEKLVGQVRESSEPARLENWHCDWDDSDLNIEAVPLEHGRAGILILFEPRTAKGHAALQQPEKALNGSPQERLISRLKQQLTDARQRLLDALDENQSSSEDSHSATEEALSANEELRSLNEELETTKEELQSTNEELISVNDELHAKNATLAKARDFATAIVETIRHPLVVLDGDLRIRMVNKAFCEAFRVPVNATTGQEFYSLSAGSWDLPILRDAVGSILGGTNSFPDLEAELDFPALGRRNVVIGGCRIDDLRMILLAIDDTTDEKRAQQALRAAEERVRQSQKMESLGRLAGGIAHDFNNLLTIILGRARLLRDSLRGNTSATSQLLEIKTAGEMAASLTQQLLSFSRLQVLHPEVIVLNTIVTDCDRMLRRLVGERITVVLRCDAELWQVRADAGELSRAIINLALNARDAMPDGGTLTVETANVTLTDDGPGRFLAPGRYAMIAVKDTGFGINAEIQAHIFEPFFTTKDVGKGTGLGLATVLGIVEQSGGAIRCESQPGQGTCFKLFLPAVAEVVKARQDTGEGEAAVPGGSEVILLVEDQDMVRGLTREILEMAGYVVFDASNGSEGLAFCESHKGPLDLLVSDVMMPGLGGRVFAENAVKLRPGLKVLFVSGHTPDVILKEGIRAGTPFLQKPYDPDQLVRAVRETLDADNVLPV